MMGAERALAGLDVGTTAVKAVVFDAGGAVLGSGRREYGFDCPEPAAVEQDPLEVWRLALEALHEAVSRSGGAEVEALGLSVQGDAIIPVDAALEPIYPAILGMDYRSGPEARWCDEAVGSRRLFELTGMRPHAMNSLVKAIWLRRRRPDVWRRTSRILTYADFLMARLAGRPAMDWTMASRTMGFDLAHRTWSGEVLARLGLDGSLLGEVLPPGSPVGAIAPGPAAETGIPRSALVAAGGHDQTCAAVGAGMVDEGLGLLSAGTADVLSTCSRMPFNNQAMFDGFYPCYLHALPGRYFTFALNHTGGILLRWYRDTLGGAEVQAAREAGRDPYDVIVEGMPPEPSALMVLPHWNGSGNPTCDMRSRGAILGLSLATTRGDIVKAVLEGLTFELRLNLDYLAEAGVRVRALRAVGGGAKSAAWLQLRADILGMPVTTLEAREAACLGAAVLAGVAAGVYRSLEHGVKCTVRTAGVWEPHAGRSAVYDGRYAVYRDVHPVLRDLAPRLQGR